MINNIEIILPKRIYVLRERKNQDIKNRPEEFSLYFKNFIHPVYPWHDITVECEYGKNLGNCWRLVPYPDVDEFELKIKIYDEYGNLVVSKGTVIELYDRDVSEPFNIICIGDSMTHKSEYVAQMQNKLYNVFTRGTRSFDGHVFTKGRGGWAYSTYFERAYLPEGGGSPVSPFLFPEGIDGKDYFGDIDYFEKLTDETRSTYNFDGFTAQKISEGQYYHKAGKLYRYGEDKPVADGVKWEFSFKKYLERNNIKTDAVSLLLGANDLQLTPYERTYEDTVRFVENTKRFVEAIKAADESIDVIINLPVCGAEQYAWGMQLGCYGSEKNYAHNMRSLSKALIQEFDGKDGVYICPMMCCIDNEYGFAHASANVNMYDNTQILYQSNWVHPNSVGYKQMGDALAGTVEMLRHKK